MRALAPVVKVKIGGYQDAHGRNHRGVHGRLLDAVNDRAAD